MMEIRICKYKCVYLFVWAVLGLHCHVGFSLVTAGGDYSLVAMLGLFTAVASLIVEDGLSALQ